MTATPPQIPTPAAVIGAGVAALVEARPTAAPYVDLGRWGDIVAGTRAQFEVARRRLAQEAAAARLPYAAGVALTDLAASEYDTNRTQGPVTAIGEVVLSRKVIHFVADGASTIQAADAVDEATLRVLIPACAQALTFHASSIWHTTTGTGSHLLSAPSPTTPVLPGLAVFSDYTGAANQLKADANAHLVGTRAGWGTWHPDPDTSDPITLADVVGNNPGAGYSSNNAASQQKLLALANATKAAIRAHLALQALAGTIRAGSTWAVLADPAAIPPVLGAQHAVSQDTPIATGIQSVVVPIEATRAGAFANLPAWSTGGPTLRFQAPALFDAGQTFPLSTSALRAAGGSDGQSDPELRRASGAAALGAYGPTVPALVAGALRTVGASRSVVREDTATGAAILYAADPAWAQSTAWLASVEQVLRDEWLGFGCKLVMGAVQNAVARLDVTVVLRDASYLADTSDITAAIQAELRAYFDDRQDWYVWRLSALRAVVSRADPVRISTCPSATVRDALGVPLAEPAQPAAGATLLHRVFADNAVQITYTKPA